MDFSNMNVQALYEVYNRKAPRRKTTINGKPFVYRYYKNPKPDKPVTIVTLAGGSGLGDGFFLFSEEIAKHYSFISFNYPMAFQNNLEQTSPPWLKETTESPVFPMFQKIETLP